MWYRVFASIPDEPDPVGMIEYLHALGHTFTPHFTGDDLGWTTARFEFPEASPITVGRYLTKPDDLRNELNAYAAELETRESEPNSVRLMELVIQTQQMFTIDKPNDHGDELCEALARWLAQRTAGILQIDGRGWLTHAGELLLKE